MKIYLDSRDLIDILSRHKPISPTDLASAVTGKGWELVYSFINICEIIVIDDLLETRRRLQVLEGLPHLYIMFLPVLRCEELRQGVTAFNRAKESMPIDPFVPLWHRTYKYPDQIDHQDKLVNQSLADQVLQIVMQNPNVCQNLSWHADSLQDSVEQDRASSDPVRRNRARFEKAVKAALSKCALPTPTAGIGKFIDGLATAQRAVPAGASLGKLTSNSALTSKITLNWEMSPIIPTCRACPMWMR